MRGRENESARAPKVSGAKKKADTLFLFILRTFLNSREGETNNAYERSLALRDIDIQNAVHHAPNKMTLDGKKAN